YWTPQSGKVIVGVQQSAFAIASFAIGATIAGPVGVRVFKYVGPVRQRQPQPILSTIYIAVALLSYLVLMPLLSGLPTITALLSSACPLLVVGVALKLWSAWSDRNRGAFRRCLVFTAIIPLLTLVTQGFLAYGTMASIVVLTFVATFYKPRW